MFNIPLHPAVVHIPIGIAVIMPFLLIGLWAAIHMQWVSSKLWGVLILFQLALFGSGLFALETGEHDEEIIETMVQEQVIEDHEESAELFVIVSGALVLLLTAGLWPHKKYGPVIKGTAAIAVVINLALAALAGHSGGELVYKYGAASAHINAIDLPPHSKTQD